MKECKNIPGVPDYTVEALAEKTGGYCLLIPIINEGGRILKELDRAKAAGVDRLADIILCDGGSTDGSMALPGLASRGVNCLLTKTGPGRQGAQLRMGLHFALERGYEGILTIDGNNKDSIESVPLFIEKLKAGYDLVQGSRFIRGGRAENTPPARWLAVRLIHAPLISLAAGHWFTDTTNAYRAYSRAYLSIRATRLGLSACEVPVTRAYPKHEPAPTKIKGFRGNSDLLKILFAALAGRYDPQ